MKSRIIFFYLLFIFLIGVLFFSYTSYTGYQATVRGQQSLLQRRKEGWLRLEAILERRVNNYNGVVGMVIRDLDTGWEISFNKDELIPSASLVKLPIMLSCLYASQDGKISLQNTVTFKPPDKVPGSKILGDAPVGSSFRVEDLIEPMITQSDNSATNMLIDYMGFEVLNYYFKKMGLKNTNIARKMMDFEERRGGQENYTTAEDMANLLEMLYRRDFLNKDISDRCLAILEQQKINDRIPRGLPRKNIIVAHKTGLERHVCHDVGIVFTPKGNFIICILVKHENRYAKYAKRFISNSTFLTYRYYQLFR